MIIEHAEKTANKKTTIKQKDTNGNMEQWHFWNDTSCEVKEFFFTEYNQGKEPEAIYAMVLTQFEFSLNNEEDKYNVLLALGS